MNEGSCQGAALPLRRLRLLGPESPSLPGANAPAGGSKAPKIQVSEGGNSTLVSKGKARGLSIEKAREVSREKARRKREASKVISE